MFDGMGAFDFDPDTLQDMETGQYGSAGTDPAQMQANAQAEYAQMNGMSGMSGMSGMDQIIPPEHLVAIAQAPHVAAAKVNSPTGILDSIKAALTARSQMKLLAEEKKLIQMQAEGKVSEDAFYRELNRINAGKINPSFMSKYGLLVVLGGLLVAGGVAFFVTRRRR